MYTYKLRFGVVFSYDKNSTKKPLRSKGSGFIT